VDPSAQATQLRRPRAEVPGGDNHHQRENTRPSGQRPRLDRRTTATADDQALTRTYRIARGERPPAAASWFRATTAPTSCLACSRNPQTIKQAIGVAY